MIIIPDVHGRTFWKDAVKGREDNEIVFLGDYLDPYSDEFEDAQDPEYEWPLDEEKMFDLNKHIVDNLNDIIAFKKAHMGNVTLLIGNHDQHYFIPDTMNGSRYSAWHARQYCKIFEENYDLFQLCLEKVIDNRVFVFSHAGILKGWRKVHYEGIPSERLCDYINNSYLVKDANLGFRLSDVPKERMGWADYGSITWADLTEHFKDEEDSHIDYQVFGHTRLNKSPIITDKFACLDVKRGFIINDEGRILEMDGTPAITLEELKKQWNVS